MEPISAMGTATNGNGAIKLSVWEKYELSRKIFHTFAGREFMDILSISVLESAYSYLVIETTRTPQNKAQLFDSVDV